jgi:Uma2 family endonuclease
MGMPATEPHMWTADEVRALPEEPGKRFECVDGVLLVSPGPRLPHQSVQSLLLEQLLPYCRQVGVGAVFTSPGELELDPRTLVQPDVFILPLVSGKRPKTQDDTGPPLLFIEILSPGTARYDRIVKRERYQRFGVEYWIADADARILERWMPTDERPEILTNSIVWQPSGASAALTVDLVTLFAEAMAD